jgi:retron-type reverse transcriptase
MAKTYKNLYRSICEFDNIHEAYIKARRLKRYTQEVLRFTAHLEENLIEIQNRLTWKAYDVGKYRYFIVLEPKKRLIAALSFSDRVVQHALCNIIEPIFERSFIFDSYACRAEKGVLAGVNRTTKFLRAAQQKWGKVYCLKMDVAQYFPSINHMRLKHIIGKHIACADTLRLIDIILDSEGADCGIPIGSLTSQLFANVYLNELDHFVKEGLGIKHYIRYMDDAIVIHHDKQYLNDLYREIKEFLHNSLCLQLNRKTQIFPVKSRGLDFLGYRIWPEYRLLRKRNIKHTKKKFKKFMELYRKSMIPFTKVNASVQSWLGHCKHADTYRLKSKVLNRLILQRKEAI